ncbi:complement factor H-like [Clupea harengus]|uniref:Complement factor H-like n=1 Tax=Clupea harengus TaxID=7950 RepID=A0A6P8G6P1_CLUHA|nr:complement factor H-like [Clupea harengus]
MAFITWCVTYVTMKTTLLLFCSLLCVATSQIDQDGVCTEPFPVVSNAEVSEEYRKPNYTDGSPLPFSCVLGYVPAGRIVYSCSKTKWARVRNGRCLPKPCELPEDMQYGSYDLVEGTDLVFGTVIKYTCDKGYQMMSQFDRRVCMLDGWSNSLPVCEVLTCELGETDSSVTMSRGNPANGEPVKYGETLHFTCAQDGMSIRGEKEVTCTSSGEWSAPFPKCEAITCARDEIHNSVQVRGLPTGNSPVAYGTKLHFSCNSNMALEGVQVVTCLKNGQWSSTFPKCVKLDKQCGPPPSVPFADIVGTSRQEYNDGDWVKFKCQSYYKLQDLRESTKCINGRWSNPITCLKPCTVTPEDMDKRNIAFKWPKPGLRYVEHGDRITFACKKDWRESLNVAFAQPCKDGRMNFPACY